MKKVFTLILILILTSICLFSLIGCGSGEPLKIVTIGDSIAEAIAGPSPLSERENYGYWSILGQRNEYLYYNRAVSGHRTYQLLNLLNDTEEDVSLYRSTIMSADIIEVSILGNDLLQNDLNKMFLQIADNNFSYINELLTGAEESFCKVIEKIKELNSRATLLIQTVYNPVYSDSKLLSDAVKNSLSVSGYSTENYRELGETALTMLNNIVRNYLKEHPGSYYIVDVYEEFDKAFKVSEEEGIKLLFPDGVHPSNAGHAVIADCTQKLLEELNLADGKKALKNYKQMRINLAERLFSHSVDMSKLKKEINSAKSCGEVTSIYFNAIEGETPVYY